MWKHTSLSLLFVGVACGSEDVVLDPATDVRILAILALVNDPYVTGEELAHGAELDARAATSIVELRPFASVEELDAVSYVGKPEIEQLYLYSVEHGYLAAYEPPSIIEMPERDDVHYEEEILRAVLDEASISDADAVVTRAKHRFDDGDSTLDYDELAQAASSCREDIDLIAGYRFAESAVQRVMEAFELEDRLALLARGAARDEDANRYLTLQELERARLDL